MSTRIRGAHRRLRPLLAPDPAQGDGPRRWVISLGVLAVVAAICGTGAFLLRGGGGDGSYAAVGGSVPAGAPTPWTVNTLDAQGVSTPAPPGPTAGAVAPSGAATDSGGATISGSATPDGGAAVRVTPDPVERVPEADRQAGIATRTAVRAGTGRLLTVPGTVRAPSPAPSMRVRVEVEEGIGADGPAFADFVMSTLNDRRGWGHGGTLSFARTDGPADFRVILASPATSATLCAPLQSRGSTSCGGGDRAVLGMDRFMDGIPDYGTDRTAYRHYLINHEVGRVLGHPYTYCTPGHLAPVMVQQTTGLHGCLPNGWPFP